MKQDVNSISLISKKEIARIMNTLSKVKFQAMVLQLPVFLKRNVLYAPFSGNFR